MKPCPACTGPLVPLRSLSVRICNDCKTEYRWTLEDGQKPLIANNRHDRKPQQ